MAKVLQGAGPDVMHIRYSASIVHKRVLSGLHSDLPRGKGGTKPRTACLCTPEHESCYMRHSHTSLGRHCPRKCAG